MIKKISKLLALILFANIAFTVEASSFLLSEINLEEKSDLASDHIIPLIYVENLEYYNHAKTKNYTNQIAEQLALSPEIVITDDKDLADYILIPRVTQSKIEKINSKNSRYSLSVVLELWAKGGTLINEEHQNRYIIIENTENPQEIAKKLLIKLLREAVVGLSVKIKNKGLQLG